MNTQRIYLDYNATSPVLPSVRDAMINAIDIFANPSSIHREGIMAKKIVTTARTDLAEILNISSGKIIFTSGGSEANATILNTFHNKTILCSSTEHASVIDNPNITATIPVMENGIIDLNALRDLISRYNPALISVMLANNETGVVQPIAEIANISYNAGVSLHCDMVQAFGKIPINDIIQYCDFVTLTFHKVGGAKGIGAIIARCNECINPLIFGGNQENRRRSGTENTVALAGLSALCREINFDMAKKLSQYHNNLETILVKSGGIIIGANSYRLPNTTCVIMPDVLAQTQLMHFDLNGIAVSSGAACSSGKVATSSVLKAMGYINANCAIRISSGHGTTQEDIQSFTDNWLKLHQKINTKKNAA